VLSFDNVSKSYGSRLLFENATFNINPYDRIGLIGRNGHGKSTLIKMIIGEESIDSGNIAIPKNYKIGYLSQKIEFSQSTVIDEVMLGFNNIEDAFEYKAEKILFGLGFDKKDLLRSPLDFSGGFQVRLNLVKILLSEIDLLLLDEPTNYLDLISIRWLKDFLSRWRGELILITHDRYFMDSVITHTVGIHRNRVRKIAGRTENFYTQIAKDEEIYEKTRLNDEIKRKELERFISRFKAKASLASRAQSRVKTLSKMDKKDKLERIKDLEFSFRYKDFRSKQLMRIDNLKFGYTPEKTLIDNFSIIIGDNEKIAIIGKNGKGKSTLLRLFAGLLTPTEGIVTYHNGISKGYFEQTNITSLNSSNTVEEEISTASENLSRSEVRGIAAAMLFSQDEALKKINVLSGGEKSRVMLAKIVATPLNLIMLDEPTNHLDIDATDGLIEALDVFDGSVIFVTHNEMLLKSLATRLIIFQGEYPYIFDGSYDQFLEKIGFDDEAISVKQSNSRVVKLDRKEIKRLKAELISKRNLLIKDIDIKINEYEENICISEERISILNNEAIGLASSGDGVKIGEVTKEILTLTDLIDNKFKQLDNISKERVKILEELNSKIDELQNQ